MEIPSPGPSSPCSTQGLLESVASSRQLCTAGDALRPTVYFGLGFAAGKPHRMMLTLTKAQSEFIFKTHPLSAQL